MSNVTESIFWRKSLVPYRFTRHPRRPGAVVLPQYEVIRHRHRLQQGQPGLGTGSTPDGDLTRRGSIACRSQAHLLENE